MNDEDDGPAKPGMPCQAPRNLPNGSSAALRSHHLIIMLSNFRRALSTRVDTPPSGLIDSCE